MSGMLVCSLLLALVVMPLAASAEDYSHDHTPPSLYLQSPDDGAIVSGAVTIAAAAYDYGSGVSRIEFRVDGQLVGTDYGPPYSAVWNVPAATGGGMKTGPAVSFAFDDTNVLQYTDYFPILRAAGYPGTVFINTNDVGQSRKMTVAQLAELRDAGWEVSSHTADHWNSLGATPTAADYEGPIAAAKAWLDANGFPDSGFASPGGRSDATIRQIIEKYHPYNRYVWGINAMPVADPYAVCGWGVDYTPLTSLTPALDTVQANGAWIVFVCHGWETPPVVFQQLVDEVKARGIPVKTVRDVVVSAPPAEYTIDVTAYDKAGNATTSTVRVSQEPPAGEAPADTTPPMVALTGVTPGTVVTGPTTLSATSSDAQSGISTVEFRVDGLLVASDPTSPYSAVWDASQASPGEHTIEARAVDGAGNVATSMVTVSVPSPPDTTPPAVTLTGPSSGAVVAGEVTVSAIASDGESGVSAVEFLVDGRLLASDGTSPYSAVWDAANESAGSHTIQARAVDGVGNAATSVAVVTVAPAGDTAPPTVRITSPSSGSSVSGRVTIKASAQDSGSGVARVEFRVNGRPVGSDETAYYSSYDAMWYVPTGGPLRNGPVVSFGFDDTEVSEYTDYYPLLRSAGHPATLFINTDDVGQAGKLSLGQLTEMYGAGWEIGSHAADHWADLPSYPSAADYEAPVARAKSWLDSHGFANSGFASPKTINNSTVKSVVSKYHPYNRCLSGVNGLPVYDPFALRGTVIDYKGSETLEDIVKDVKEHDDWAIFTSSAFTSTYQLSRLIEACRHEGVPIRTVYDVAVGYPRSDSYTIEVEAIDKAGNAATTSLIVKEGYSGYRY